VVAVAHRQDLVAAARGARQQQRRLVGLGSGRGEEHLGVVDGHQVGDLLGELDLRLDQVQRRRVQDACRLPLDGLDHLRQAVGGQRGQDAAEEVEIAIALGVPHVTTFTAPQRDGLVVVQGHPRRQHRPVSREQVGVHDRRPPVGAARLVLAR
jgi:hypothetical protein